MTTRITPIVTIGFDISSSFPPSPPRESGTLESEKDNVKDSSEIEVAREQSASDLNSKLSQSENSIEAGNENTIKQTDEPSRNDGVSSNDSIVEPATSSTTSVQPKKMSVDDFAFGKLLGEGSFGEVRLAVEIATEKEWAIKILDKSQIIKEKKAKNVSNEKAVMDLFKHPNILYLFCTFQDTNSLYFVVEYCPNGDLLSYVQKAGKFDEDCCRFYFAEMVSALEQIHSKGVVHRDLKPENVLLDKNMHLKLSDFGSAEIIGNDPNARSSIFTGTAEYVSPELLTEKCAGKASDLWSLGCTFYYMLSGKLPFSASNAFQTFQLISNRSFHYPSHFSPLARDLIDRLLDSNPTKRLGVGTEGMIALKEHPFFIGINWNTLSDQVPPIPSSLASVTSVRSNSINLTASKSPSIESSTHDETINAGELRLLIVNHEQREKLLEMQKSSVWVKFMEANELIIHSALVWKKRGFFSKKRQLILTDAPRFFYVDPEKMVIKGKISWSNQPAKLKISIKTNRHFSIIVPGRTYILEDISNASQKWEVAILQLQKELSEANNSTL